MTRKNRKPITDRRRARRARRNSRARRASSSPRAQSMTMILPTGATVVGGVDASFEDHVRYLDAHALLPPGYPWPEDEIEAHLQAALGTLAEPSSNADQVLEAIMMLAHIGDSRALSALAHHGTSRRVHADMARLAENECAMWLASDAPAPRWSLAGGNAPPLN